MRDTMHKSFLLAMSCLLGLSVLAASEVRADSDSQIIEKINEYLRQGWEDNEVKPSPRAPDGEWARRVSLDIIGHIPSFDMLMDFIEDTSADKRTKFVDLLLDHPSYIKNETNLWGNMLVGRSGNRRGNRANLDAWLRRQFYRNTPYDEFVKELVSAEGSSETNGAVAFLSSHLNENAVPATSITSRLFLGLQVQCTQCHNHPFNDWKQDQFWSMNAFFRGTQRARGGNAMAAGLADNPVTDVVFFEKRSGLMQATERKFVDGTKVPITETAKPRQQLAELITDPTKPFLARAHVNRLWGRMFGFGFTKPIDDMGPHNPPSHPELLDYLAEQFKLAKYDQKRLIRWIAASKAYNLTSRKTADNEYDRPEAGETPLFTHVYLKNFSAEQLYDSLIVATDAHKVSRDSDAAENQRQSWLRQFVQTFGTDENDDFTTFNGTIPQALVMMNGGLTQSALSGAPGGFLQRVLDAPGGELRPSNTKKPRRPVRVNPANRTKNMPKKIESLFLVALARKPTTEEMEAINTVFQESGQVDPINGLQDVFWAILNSNEFIINH